MNGFSADETKLLKEFYSHCFNTPLGAEQKTTSWSLSYWTYEVMEHLILGEEEYMKAPSPPWLETKPTYREHKALRNYGIVKRMMFRKLKEMKDLADNLVVCEVGYGVDIVLSMMVKDWNEIRCYDMNGGLEILINEFFVQKYGLNVKFERSNSNHFRFDEIENPTIVISNNTHISVGEWSDRIRNNENLIYLRDGEVLDRKDMPKTVEECRKTLCRGWF